MPDAPVQSNYIPGGSIVAGEGTGQEERDRMKPQTRQHITQAGGMILIGGGVFWGIAEIMALVAGESTTESLVIATVAFIDIAVGIWSVRMAEGDDPGPFTMFGIGAMTVGFLMFGVIRVMMAIDSPGGEAGRPADSPIFAVAAMISLLGALTFGVAIVRSGLRLPRWTGAALILGMLVTLMAAAADVPPEIPHLANIVMAITLTAIGVVVLRTEGKIKEG